MGSLKGIHQGKKMIRTARDLSCPQLECHISRPSQLCVLGLKALCPPLGCSANCHIMCLEILEQHCPLTCFVMMQMFEQLLPIKPRATGLMWLEST